MNGRYQHLFRFALTCAVALALVLLWSDPERNALARVYGRFAKVLTDARHIPRLSLDRLDPTCPQCM